MSYVIGVDLGTSAVKVLLVDEQGTVRSSATESYPLIQERSGYNEQRPDDWVDQTAAAIRALLRDAGVAGVAVKGISFSGQMHGLVLLDGNGNPIRNAILWNDTRTTEQCRRIEQTLGTDLLTITRNRALEGFTLPKLLWVEQHEPGNYEQARTFLLPKDYLRYRMTGELGMDVSDAAGTLLLDVERGRWSERVLQAFGIAPELCPPILQSAEQAGTVTAAFAEASGLAAGTPVYAGGADNACGALGSGILEPGSFLCSIGTSGVVLGYEADASADYEGKLHFFNHAVPDRFYAMGVTLSAGYSLSWFKDTFAKMIGFDELLAPVDSIQPGSEGLLFTPYLVGERTPHADSDIRGSFIGVDAKHQLGHFARSVLEGITFSLNETVDLLREAGKSVSKVISIGGGAKNKAWLQMQADVFGAEIYQLSNEQGPGLGAAMLAAVGCGWYGSLQECGRSFVQLSRAAEPNEAARAEYAELFGLYRQVYAQTADLNRALKAYRS